MFRVLVSRLFFVLNCLYKKEYFSNILLFRVYKKNVWAKEELCALTMFSPTSLHYFKNKNVDLLTSLINLI